MDNSKAMTIRTKVEITIFADCYWAVDFTNWEFRCSVCINLVDYQRNKFRIALGVIWYGSLCSCSFIQPSCRGYS